MDLTDDNCPDCPHSYYMHPLKGASSTMPGVSQCFIRFCRCTNQRVPMPLPHEK
jgi:hypothetical protein